MTFKKLCFLSILYFVCGSAFCQTDSIALDEVVIPDRQLRLFSNTQQVAVINDSIIRKNAASLTSLLNYNTSIYFKENGFGMVSSPSFRGTTAQQTAVIWNGININSQFNGQTDFNTLNATDFDEVTVRAGGGSALYGSSAIGGSIHLQNTAEFESLFSNEIKFRYGSFNTFEGNYKIRAATKKVSFRGGISHIRSDNDFDFPDDLRKNINGQFKNTGVSTQIGYKFNNTHSIIYTGYLFEGDRHFSVIFPTDPKTKYIDGHIRNLLEWNANYGKYSSKLKAAYLSESYQYFPEVDLDFHYFGKAETYIAKYDGAYRFSENLLLNGIADHSVVEGNGSDVGKNRRQITSGSLMLKHKLSNAFLYEVVVRKDFADEFESPLLFSAGANLKVTEKYSVKVNGSKNFRIPTFNDLYWIEGGNPDLRPETSYQAEIGNEYKTRNLFVSATAFFISIDDMIQWLPGTSSAWLPQNVNSVTSYGLEAVARWQMIVGGGNIKINGTYSYTVSENNLTGYQLIYVPFHKATASAAWSFGGLEMYCQMLFTGEVFTRSDNNPAYNINPYSVSNVGFEYRLFKFLSAGFEVRNMFNKSYSAVENRPFPGRNYNFNLTFKF